MVVMRGQPDEGGMWRKEVAKKVEEKIVITQDETSG